MNDVFVNAMNTQKVTTDWMNGLGENMINVYTPGYRQSLINFKTYLQGVDSWNNIKKLGQGKSTPGTSKENVFFEGEGYFVLREPSGRKVYTRLGEFTFDAEGVYKSSGGLPVQGYILNDKGEVMNGTKPVNTDIFNETALNGGTVNIPTTNIKLWIDPNNGKYLGKYDDFEFKGDGILYGKANGGKVSVPLYKLALSNFHNPEGLYEFKPGQFLETVASGSPVVGRGEIRGGLIELSNVDLRENISAYRQAKMQSELVNKLISTNKQLLQGALELLK